MPFNVHFPSCWNIFKNVPVPKKTSPSTLADSCPISILSSLSKTWEILINFQVVRHLNDDGFLSKYQSAYRIFRGTSTVLLNSECDSNLLNFLLLLDFSKAFDTISYEILLNKLQIQFHFLKSTVQLCSSYLLNRYQYMSINLM